MCTCVVPRGVVAAVGAAAAAGAGSEGGTGSALRRCCVQGGAVLCGAGLTAALQGDVRDARPPCDSEMVCWQAGRLGA